MRFEVQGDERFMSWVGLMISTETGRETLQRECLDQPVGEWKECATDLPNGEPIKFQVKKSNAGTIMVLGRE